MACTQKVVPRLIDDVLPSSNTLHECWAGPDAFGETMPRHALLLNNTTKNTNGPRIRAVLWRIVPFLHPWKCFVVRELKRRCFARDMACSGKVSIRAEYCANQTKTHLISCMQRKSTYMRSPPLITVCVAIINIVIIIHN